MSKNKEYRKSLFKLLSIVRFLVVAPSYSRLRKKLSHVYLWRVYQTAFCAVNIYIYYLSIANPKIPRKPYSDYLLEVSSLFIIRLIFSISMLGLIFTSTRKWEEMLTYIIEVEEELMPYYNLCKPFKVRMIILRYSMRFVFLISMIASKGMVALDDFVEWLLLNGIVLLEVNLLILVIDDVANIINMDFELLNEVLVKDYLQRNFEWKEIKIFKSIDINKVTKIYTNLYKIIELYNELFGWEIVLMNVLAVISSLPALEAIISLKLDKTIVPEMLYVFWKIMPCMIITKTCHHAARKGERFGALIFKISNSFPHSSQYEFIKDDMKFLRELYDEFRPQFSAAGVFVIDYTVYYALFTLIMSYLAILMQFKYAS